MFEAEVHHYLKNILREQDTPSWPHHLTMARLVARALRLHRSTLIQTGTTTSQYALSYLTPALLDQGSVLLVIPQNLQQELLEITIPQLQKWLKTEKLVVKGSKWPNNPPFPCLFLTTPEEWLSDRLSEQPTFPLDLPTLIDPIDDLENLTINQLTVEIMPQNWQEIRQSFPESRLLREMQVKLTKAIFSHPPNPYQCYLLDQREEGILTKIFAELTLKQPLSPLWQDFYQKSRQDDYQLWATVNRAQGSFILHCSPLEIATTLKPLWLQQTLILMGSFLDQETLAPLYRQQIGLETTDLTCLKFTPNRQNDYLKLYLPERLPLPNTPQFQHILINQIQKLINLKGKEIKLIVILVNDLPLKNQIAVSMAAEFGSRVQVEKTILPDNAILVSSWEFWHNHQQYLPAPEILMITTLPIPSLENPLVAAQVSYYKRQRLDWFRLYLLPSALKEINKAVITLRQRQGVVALWDNRVNHRSYGTHILNVLSPFMKINYLDSPWFSE